MQLTTQRSATCACTLEAFSARLLSRFDLYTADNGLTRRRLGVCGAGTTRPTDRADLFPPANPAIPVWRRDFPASLGPAGRAGSCDSDRAPAACYAGPYAAAAAAAAAGDADVIPTLETGWEGDELRQLRIADRCGVVAY